MNLHENSIFGRKVFFLSPSYDVQKNVIDHLCELEFEIYILKDIKNVKNILKNFPHSICFINIDEIMEASDWFNFVHSFEDDENLATIFLGIMSQRAKTKDKELFLLNATIPAGFINTAVNFSELAELFQQILELNGAKGRRKYVRADCEKDSLTYAHIKIGNIFLDLKIKDISSVGFSCIVPTNVVSEFKPNTVIRNCTIILHDKKITIPSAVIMVKNIENKHYGVFLYLKGILFSSKTTIRNYISSRLMRLLLLSTEGMEPDETDYSITPEPKADEDKTFLLSDYLEPVEDLETFEEGDLTLTQLF